ncbi:family 78 glycoside hydrolase catalytic domain [Pirellulimonas nuda]|uniref:family 78 glycoside hydrolase catalytic domain n=1 Tax=Pirellulimonas nuda TaxID=2528009 RepID=UPI0018D3D6A5|nr:family 78 glycoside hydrolase catalytic domain [Pirellulimonas nuda]
MSCEQLLDPQGIETPAPRLSWTLASDQRGERQTAYRVVAASTPELLAVGRADLWDSGRVDASDSVLVPYAGRLLASHERCVWKVRVWGREGGPSAWSEPAEWLTGRIGSSPWPGEWIGLAVPTRIETLAGTSWIAAPDDEPGVAAPAGVTYFRKAFEVPDEGEVDSAVFRVAADDRVAIFLNGRDLGSRSGPSSTKELNVTHRLLPGRNVIAVAVTNDGDAPSPSGLVAWLRARLVSGAEFTVVSDGAWLTSRAEAHGWNAPGLDDSGWVAAETLGQVGMPPWGPVRHAESRRLAARYLRKRVDLAKPIRRTVVSYSGLGLSELYVNGRKIGDQVLSPAMMEYPKRLPYVTRDVTGALVEGENAIGVVLGSGRFYSPRSEVYASMPTYGSPMLRLVLEVEHTDGSRTVVVSDGSWRLTDDGPIVANNEYDGEEYDARKELTGWSEADYNDTAWRPAEVLSHPAGELSAPMIEPIRVTETIQPKRVHQPRPGAYVFDLGQNMVGWCRLRVRGPAGARVRLRHAETLLPDGNLALANLRTAKATDVYTLKGDGLEVWEPRFTTHGFRYVEVTGYPGTPSLSAIEGRVAHDDLQPTGRFECSNPILNQVYRNAVWGLRGNYRSVPTDCPQRDERQGWLGDRLEIARGESYMFDVAAFYAKWLRDIRDAQQPSGSLPDVAPAHWPTYTDNVVWPSASVLLPGMLHEQYGDKRPIERQYQSSQGWIRHMSQYVEEGLIGRDSYGDWCVPPEDPLLIHSDDPTRKTDAALLASAFFSHDLERMQRYAEMLARPSDAAWFAERASEISRALNARYFDPAEGAYGNGTQTSCVIPLAFGLVPTAGREVVFDRLVRNVTKVNHGHIATGLVGGQYLLQTLTRGGRADLAYQIAAQEDYPSWGYMASRGATTIWELWNGDTADPAMNSGNHVMLIGDLLTWLYEDLAGIAPDPAAPGFKRILMRPQPVEGLDYVVAAHRSPYGWIESEWRRTKQGLAWRVVVPPNATATLYLPARGEAQVTESSVPIQRAEGVTPLGVRSGRLVVRVASGRYDFEIDHRDDH